jgi:cytosine/adenosine deaminase-related metal-dependent hydrolase
LRTAFFGRAFKEIWAVHALFLTTMMLRDYSTDSTDSYSNTLIIAAGKLFDPYERALLGPHVITVNTDSGLIEDVKPDDDGFQSLDFFDTSTVDLRGQTVLPGFVDAHVHCECTCLLVKDPVPQVHSSLMLCTAVFLHPYSETTWEDQLTKESLMERTIRASVHAKKTLLAGYTAVR